MTRQQFTKNKIFEIFLMSLEVLILIASGILAYTSKHKMGMQRHMVYVNSKLEEAIAVDAIRLGLIMLLLIFVILLFNNISRKKIGFRIIWTGLLLVGNLAYLVFYSKDLNRSYYYIAILLSLASLVQIIIYKLGSERRV